MNKILYNWTDNPTVSEVSKCDTDVLNDCLMHLKYNHSSGSGFSLGDIVQKDHILNFEESEGLALLGTYVYKEAVAGSRYGYPDFYNKYIEYKNNATATETTLGNSTITIYNNANGLKFYDIADKSIIDDWFTTTGEAMYYGIDEENERIFLPRRTRTQTTLDISEVNDYIEAGLPNITGTYSGMTYGNVSTGACVNTDIGQYIDGSSKVLRAVNFDASQSNPIYGNSDTVQPSASLVLEYMVVGNTRTENAQTDVTEITTSENDTLPLFHNFYSKEDMTTTGAYANATLGSWLGGNVYTTAYNELVNKLGTENVKANTDTYTDYDFVVNQENMTFRLPLKNGQEIMFATGVKGNGITLGFTDGTSNAGLSSNTQQMGYIGPSNYGKPVGSSQVTSTFSTSTTIGVTTDSTKSGIELDTQNITIPDGWNLYYKVANAVTNLGILDVAGITADINTKLSRGNAEEITSWGIPDYTAGVSLSTATGSTFQATTNGVVIVRRNQTTTSANKAIAVSIDDVWVMGGAGYNNDSSQRSDCYMALIGKDSVMKVQENTTDQSTITFYPLKGAN